MNQPMDFNAMMQGCILSVATRVKGMMMLELIFTILPRERTRLTDTLNREPAQEDWDDYSQFLGERTLNLKCLQRAEDREKIRRLVFGEDGENTETS
jgi:hypothetical protein